MRVAVNTRFLLPGCLEGYGYFIQETFRHIVQQHPEHEFIFIFDRPFDQQFVFGKNVTPVVTGPAARHPLLWKLWYDIKVPSVLRKYKADVFVSCDGFCSLTTKTPQCLVLHDLAFLHHPSFISKSHLFFYRRYTAKFLHKAKSVATVSAFSKADIIKQYAVEPAKLDVVYSAAKPGFGPVDFEEKQKIKEQYTGGAEYFIYTGAIHPRKNLVSLLKAFSLFKKKQNSSMKLVLAGRLAWKSDTFKDSLASYKYRNDVVMTGYLPETELASLTAAAYAMVYPSHFEGFGVPVLEAMQCGVPVITTSASSMQEVAGDAALYAPATDHEAIAAHMILLYKDENLRTRLITEGLQVAKQYTWERTAALLWQCIEKAIG